MKLVALLFLFFLLNPPAARADEPVTPLSHWSENIVNAFSGYRLGLQAGAVGATVALIRTNVDAHAREYFKSGNADNWADPAYFAPFVLPPLLIVGFYIGAKTRSRDAERLSIASFAALQACLLAEADQTLLKLFTGRPYPGEFSELTPEQESRKFQPGIGRGGIWSGWPSGHTIVISALFSSLASYYDTPAWWAAFAGATAYVGVGMTAARGASQHWLSDVVAGGLMGFSIGSSVGKGFRELEDSRAAPEGPRLSFYPILGNGAFGAGLRLH